MEELQDLRAKLQEVGAVAVPRPFQGDVDHALTEVDEALKGV